MIVTASSLNVRSGPGTTFRVLSQLERGEEVTALETNGDWVWVQPGYGWVSSAYLAHGAVEAPVGLQQIISRFGPPGAAACSAGRVRLPAPLKLGWSSARVTVVACHIDLEEVFTKVFREIHDSGLWDLLKTFDGIYNDRSARGSGKKSTHAWGIAVDLNASTNRMGSHGDMDERIVSIFKKHGFTWLGPTHDPMHFQFASKY